MRLFSFIDHTRGDLDGFDFLLWCFIAFDKSAFLSHFNLNSARFTAGVSLLNLSCLFASQRDFLFFTIRSGTVYLAQMP